MNKKQFSVITIFPEIIEGSLQFGVIGQAIKNGLIQINCINPRSYSKDKHKSVDDRPFGGGDGMVMMCDPISQAIDHAILDSQAESNLESVRVIYLSPQGSTLNHEKVLELSKYKHLVFICGRYGGIDQRVLNAKVDEEISIGDYVLSGGELAAAVVIDAVSRHVEGVLGHNDSSVNDSFSDGLLEAPVFTRPREWGQQIVPDEFLGGHHENIKKLQRVLSLIVTLKKRPDLLNNAVKNKQIKVSELKNTLKSIEKLSDSELHSLGLDNRDCESFKEWVKAIF